MTEKSLSTLITALVYIRWPALRIIIATDSDFQFLPARKKGYVTFLAPEIYNNWSYQQTSFELTPANPFFVGIPDSLLRPDAPSLWSFSPRLACSPRFSPNNYTGSLTLACTSLLPLDSRRGNPLPSTTTSLKTRQLRTILSSDSPLWPWASYSQQNTQRAIHED